MAILVTFKAIQVSHIFMLVAVTSMTRAFEQPVRQVLLPQLVRREDLVNALALNAVTWNGAGFLGPSLVGLPVGWIGIDGCVYINAISCLAGVCERSAGLGCGWTRLLGRRSGTRYDYGFFVLGSPWPSRDPERTHFCNTTGRFNGLIWLRSEPSHSAVLCALGRGRIIEHRV